jgi:DNA invertase Pin-like site-specific DNA recombinase
LPAGRQYGQFERSLIAERVRAGMVRAKKQGRRLGRPEKLNGDLDALIPLIATGALSQRAAARRLGVSVSTLSRSLLRKGHPVSQPRPVVGASSGNVLAPGGSAAQASPA